MENRWDNIINASSGDIRRLSSVWRYSSVPVVEKENVAEHCYWVALYAAMIHNEINDNKTILGNIVLKALSHDINECVTGDIIRIFKYLTPELKKEIDNAEKIMSKTLPIEINNLDYVYDDDILNMYIKHVIKAADFMSLFQYMRREAIKCNLDIIPYYNRMIKDIGDMSEKHVPHNLENYTKMSNFPASFYGGLQKEAMIIASECFHGLEKSKRWNRQI